MDIDENFFANNWPSSYLVQSPTPCPGASAELTRLACKVGMPSRLIDGSQYPIVPRPCAGLGNPVFGIAFARDGEFDLYEHCGSHEILLNDTSVANSKVPRFVNTTVTQFILCLARLCAFNRETADFDDLDEIMRAAQGLKAEIDQIDQKALGPDTWWQGILDQVELGQM